MFFIQLFIALFIMYFALMGIAYMVYVMYMLHTQSCDELYACSDDDVVQYDSINHYSPREVM